MLSLSCLLVLWFFCGFSMVQMSEGVLSRQAMEAMLRIYDPVQLSWKAIRQNFLILDRNRSGKISIQDFRITNICKNSYETINSNHFSYMQVTTQCEPD